MADQTVYGQFFLGAESYWSQSRRPVVSLVFIAPLMVIYEAGVLLWGVQNGADLWMRRFLDHLGFSQHLLLPLLTVCALMAWHYLIHEPWRFSPSVLWPMLAECLLLAICLRIILILQTSFLLPMRIAAEMSIGNKIKTGVGYLGAGIYEELLFRMLLLTAVVWIIRWWWTSETRGLVLAVILSSIAFAAAHYVGQSGETFHWFSFVFRFIAGIFFSILFIYRGFGIAAGAHAAYDILVGLF